MAEVVAPCEAGEPRAHLAVAPRQLAVVERAQLPDQRDAVRREAVLHRRADPPQEADRLVREKGAGVAPLTGSVPVRSRNASSIDSGSTSGVTRRISARTARPTSRYFAMSGRITTACGQRSSAWNIGIAERTP